MKAVMIAEPGHQLGPYQIVSLLGIGGMGRVYRAHDTRLRRDVALKTINPEFSSESSLLERFELEARTAAQLNHPNIATVYDVGTVDGTTFVVSELVSGRTLRKILDDHALTLRDSLEYAMQIANGLAAAHEHGIIHRDLKPENVIVSDDGVAKIVDFGLAKLTVPLEDESTLIAPTKPGVVMGTPAYMAPEQARGQDVDHRVDLFGFGAVLYEMLAGRRAFEGETSSDILASVLTSDPTPITSVSPALDRIVRHCLEKKRERRFQSARDVTFALEAVLSPSGAVVMPMERQRSFPWRLFAALLIAAVIAAAGTYALLRRQNAGLRYHQLTFRNGTIEWARFSPDGNTVAYGAAWEGNPIEIFTARADAPDSTALGLRDADVAAISSTGEMLVLLHPRPDVFWSRVGTLARVSLSGGVPREILDGVNEADWSPDGSQIAVVRERSGRAQVEYPIGNVLFSTSGWMTSLRVRPDGKALGFLHHPSRPDDGGEVTVVDLQRRVRVLSRGWVTVNGLAWRGSDLLFTAGKSGILSLYAVSSFGKQRLVAENPSSLKLLDISRSGQLLITDTQLRALMNVVSRQSPRERDLSWLDFSVARDISSDGRTILFDESAAGGGPKYGVYIRRTDGSPAVRISDGIASALSPDGRWALTFDPHRTPVPLVIVPTGVGEPRQLLTPHLDHSFASWFPDGRSILFDGIEPGHGSRLYVQHLDGGAAVPITPDGVRIANGKTVSPDGRLVVATSGRQSMVYPADGKGAPRPIPSMDGEARFVGWSNNPKFLYVATTQNRTLSVNRIDITTGKTQRTYEIPLVNVAGIFGRPRALVSADGETLVYGINHLLTNLFVVDEAH
ncbi:MAG: hypothetical protein NVSMB68_00690 [Thermoanaerobaculia bacterium]